MKALTAIARILVGCLFIFSGFIKANDPLGFGYKMDEYFEVFHMEWLLPLSLFIAISICVVEMVLGFALLLGARVKLTLWLLVLMILYFTFLTFYSAYYDKVKSCGCFGDFLPLTPWQSFYKDVALCILITILVIGKNYINPILGSKLESASMVMLSAASIGFPTYTYMYLPVYDFRAYAIGKNITEGMKGVPDKVKFYYTFENTKTKEKKEFDVWQADTLAWKYINNRTEILEKGIEPKVKDFSIMSLDGSDYTQDFIENPEYVFLLVEYDLSKTNKGVQGKVTDFAQLCTKDSVPFIALTATGKGDIDKFKTDTGANYDFYNSDGTTLKTMIRSNPGLMLIKGGTVMAMWPYRSFPSYTDVKEKYLKK